MIIFLSTLDFKIVNILGPRTARAKYTLDKTLIEKVLSFLTLKHVFSLLADCVWDAIGCRKNSTIKKCCDDRFDVCSTLVKENITTNSLPPCPIELDNQDIDQPGIDLRFDLTPGIDCKSMEPLPPCPAGSDQPGIDLRFDLTPGVDCEPVEPLPPCPTGSDQPGIDLRFDLTPGIDCEPITKPPLPLCPIDNDDLSGLIPGVECKALPFCAPKGQKEVEINIRETPGVTCIPLPPCPVGSNVPGIDLRFDLTPGVDCDPINNSEEQSKCLDFASDGYNCVPKETCSVTSIDIREDLNVDIEAMQRVMAEDSKCPQQGMVCCHNANEKPGELPLCPIISDDVGIDLRNDFTPGVDCDLPPFCPPRGQTNVREDLIPGETCLPLPFCPVGSDEPGINLRFDLTPGVDCDPINPEEQSKCLDFASDGYDCVLKETCSETSAADLIDDLLSIMREGAEMATCPEQGMVCCHINDKKPYLLPLCPMMTSDLQNELITGVDCRPMPFCPPKDQKGGEINIREEEGLIEGLTCQPLPPCQTDFDDLGIDLRTHNVDCQVIVPDVVVDEIFEYETEDEGETGTEEQQNIQPKCTEAGIDLGNGQLQFPGLTCVGKKTRLPPCHPNSDLAIDLGHLQSKPGLKCDPSTTELLPQEPTLPSCPENISRILQDLNDYDYDAVPEAWLRQVSLISPSAVPVPGVTCKASKLPPCPKEDSIDIRSQEIPGLTCQENAQTMVKMVANILSKAISKFVEETGIEIPDQVFVNTETSPELTEPEINVGGDINIINSFETINPATINATIKLPGDSEQTVKFQVSIPKSLGTPTTIDNEKLAATIVEKLERVTETIAFLEQQLGDEDMKIQSLPEVIASAVILYVKQGKSLESIDMLKFTIEIKKELQFPEVEVRQGISENALETVVRFPGVEQTVKFQVDVPKKCLEGSSQESIQGVDFDLSVPQPNPILPLLCKDLSIDTLSLIDAIKTKLTKASATKSFIDKLTNEETKQVTLAEVIANSVAIYIAQNQVATANKLDLQIDIVKGLEFPEIVVKPGNAENELQSIAKFPGVIDRSLTVEIDISNNLENLDQLASDISESFDTFSNENNEEIDGQNGNTLPKLRQDSIQPPPCSEDVFEPNINLRSGELSLPGVTCTLQPIDCSTLPMKFYSFSGKPASTTSK